MAGGWTSWNRWVLLWDVPCFGGVLTIFLAGRDRMFRYGEAEVFWSPNGSPFSWRAKSLLDWPSRSRTFKRWLHEKCFKDRAAKAT